MARYKIINNVEYDISLNISPFKNEKKKKNVTFWYQGNCQKPI